MYQLVSDLHTEGMSNCGFDVRPFSYFSRTHADTLFLAGDIGNSLTLESFLREACDYYENVVMVAGNHEFYNTSVEAGIDALTGYDSRIKNFSFLNNETIWIDGVAIFGGTMWSNPSPSYHGSIMADIRDFSAIKDWNINKHMSFFEIWYREFVAAEKSVVLSHFLPSFSSVPTKFKGLDALNSYYATEMGYNMDGIKVWAHGHTHSPMDYFIGDTNIVCNPHGYNKEQVKFDDGRIIMVRG